MSNFVQQIILPILDQIIDPFSGRSLLGLNAVSQIQWVEGKISLSVTLGYPGTEIQQLLSEQVWARLSKLDDVISVDVDIGWQAPINVNLNTDRGLMLSGVQNIISVASGKGGVGKSTLTANLALSMAKMGAKVGVLDADIYGPSQGMMLGIGFKRPEIRDEKIMLPHEKYGVKSMSMGYLVNDKTPIVWRGPMATTALQQMIFETDWQNLDYLFIDMPPGTGDIQLTLSQKVPITAALIVTTPQDVALLDVQKAIGMFNKVSIPILGIVENMWPHQCGQCGHVEHIFGTGGGARIAKDYNSLLLGTLPLALSIREYADGGKPSVVSEPNSDISREYSAMAQKMAASLWIRRLDSSLHKITVVSED